MKDLHIHTKYSDGEYDENEIIKRIIDAKIDEFAICDHDTIEGSKRVFNVLKSQNSKLIFHSGVELSCRIKELFGGINVHLLVRDFDFNNKDIIRLIEEISALRLQKISRMVDFVDKIYGVKISQEEIEQVLKNTKSFGKPHIFSLLNKHGNFDRELFYKNMNNLKTGDLKLDAIKVLHTFKDGGAVVTLAHPIEIMEEYNLSYDDIDGIVAYLKTNGLMGLETKHSKHTEKDAKIFSDIAKKYNLQESCGSDYHGERVKPDVLLGVCEKE